VVQGASIIFNFEFSILNSRTTGPKTGAGFWVLDPPPHPERVNHRAAFNSKFKIQNSKFEMWEAQLRMNVPAGRSPNNE
jgi:hypothetical protein